MTTINRASQSDIIIYALLLGISTLYFSFFEPPVPVIGILTLLWSIVLLLRVKTLLHVTQHLERAGHFDYSQTEQKLTLPRTILRQMEHEEYIRRGVLALRALRVRTMIWVFVSCITLGFGLYVTISPNETAITYRLLSELEAFFQSTINEQFNYESQSILTIMVRVSIQFIVISACWLGQSYAYRNHNNILLWIYAFLFCVAFLVNFGNNLFSNLLLVNIVDIPDLGHGWDNIKLLKKLAVLPNQPYTSFSERAYELGKIGLVFFYLPGFYCFAALIRSLFREYDYAVNAFWGLLILMIMLWCDLFLAASIHMVALWITGWSFFSYFWIRSGKYARKSYRLYQGI